MLALILLIILINLSFNMTMQVAYAISISIALFIATIVVKAVDFTNAEELDLFLERHLWKLTLVWVILLVIYFVFNFYY